MSDPTNQTERDQIDVLIGMKKDEIKNLEGLKDQFTDDYVPEIRTPAEVAADPDVDAAERAAAANAVLGQDPAIVNAEQSLPTPSTHDSAKEGANDDNAAEETTVEDVPEDDSDSSTDDSTGDDDKPEVEDDKSDDTEDTKEKKPATKKASAKKS